MADDVVVTALFLEAWQKLSPEQRASSPIGVGYGMGFEAYKEYVHSPPWPEAKNMEFHRLFIAPIAIYDKATMQEWVRMQIVLKASQPMSVPVWFDPEALELLEEFTNVISEPSLDLIVPPLTLQDYILRRSSVKEVLDADKPGD
jgi:hypothetical protein